MTLLMDNSYSYSRYSQMLTVALHVTIIAPFCLVDSDFGDVSTVLTGAASAALLKRSRSCNSGRPGYMHRADESGKRGMSIVCITGTQT